MCYNHSTNNDEQETEVQQNSTHFDTNQDSKEDTLDSAKLAINALNRQARPLSPISDTESQTIGSPMKESNNQGIQAQLKVDGSPPAHVIEMCLDAVANAEPMEDIPQYAFSPSLAPSSPPLDSLVAHTDSTEDIPQYAFSPSLAPSSPPLGFLVTQSNSNRFQNAVSHQDNTGSLWAVPNKIMEGDSDTQDSVVKDVSAPLFPSSTTSFPQQRLYEDGSSIESSMGSTVIGNYLDQEIARCNGVSNTTIVSYPDYCGKPEEQEEEIAVFEAGENYGAGQSCQIKIQVTANKIAVLKIGNSSNKQKTQQKKDGYYLKNVHSSATPICKTGNEMQSKQSIIEEKIKKSKAQFALDELKRKRMEESKFEEDVSKKFRVKEETKSENGMVVYEELMTVEEAIKKYEAIFSNNHEN